MAIGKLVFAPVTHDFNSLETTLLNVENFNSAVSNWKTIDYHTSIEDLELKTENVNELLDNINTVDFLDIENIYATNPTILLKIAYLILTDYEHLVNSNKDVLTKLFFKAQFQHSYFNYQPKAKTDKKKLWIAGCSLSAPNNVPINSVYQKDSYVNDKERWGYIVSQELGYEEMNLARQGSSILTALQQIIRANIDSNNDILVWQITALTRPNLIDQEGYFRPFATDVNYIKDTLSSKYQTHFHQEMLSLNYIQMGIEYCKKQNIKLHIVNMLGNTMFLENSAVDYLDLYGTTYIDYGADKMHPGPKQNAEYAKEIIKYIQGE